MPRKPVVDRTVQIIEIEYSCFDRISRNETIKRIRLPDKRWKESTIINKIDEMNPTEKVIDIIKITSMDVNFTMPLEQYILLAKEKKDNV